VTGYGTGILRGRLSVLSAAAFAQTATPYASTGAYVPAPLCSTLDFGTGWTRLWHCNDVCGLQGHRSRHHPHTGAPGNPAYARIAGMVCVDPIRPSRFL
jgi:hypothetical protein